MEGIYRFKQTAPQIQELLDKVPENAAGVEENRVAIEGLSAEVEALKEREIRVTYVELVGKLQSAKLVAGKVYRITDYETVLPSTLTTAQSAGHVFDVLVTAIAENELSEDARAIHRDNDDYFNNSALKGWELKYSIWNDTTRFSWADEVNGKGVIYFMRDEFGNEAPYDFKNVQFKRWNVTDNVEGRNIRGYMGTLENLAEGLTIPDEDDWRWAYTFDNNGEDASLKVVGNNVARGNVISEARDNRGKNVLADNVFYGVAKQNILGYDCGTNTFRNATGNTLGSDCGANVIMSMSWNTIGLSFFGNSVESLQGCTINNNVSSNVWKAVTNTNIGTFVDNNAWEKVYDSTIGNSIAYTLMEGTLRYVQILDGVQGDEETSLYIPFDADAGTDVQCAGVIGGVVKVWKPGERGLRVVEVEATFPTFTLKAEVGKYYRLDQAETLNLVLPVPDANEVASVVLGVPFSGGASLTVTSEADVRYQDGFAIEEMTTYEIKFIWNGMWWVISAMKIGGGA